MARTLPILSALGRAIVRDLRSLNSLAGNNFFIFCFLLLRESGLFVFVIAGILLLFPLGADPMGRLPKERFESWPLSAPQRIRIRVFSLFLSPAFWLTALLVLLTASFRLGLQFLGLVVLLQAAGSAAGALRARTPQAGIFRWTPPLPGRLGRLIRKDLRQLLSVLDPYPAVMLMLSCVAYQWIVEDADPEARFGVTILVVLAMSTSAQCLFALDGPGGLERYRLWPVSGWRILLAKNLAFLIVTVTLCLPLAPLAALAAALVAVAVGNRVSVHRPVLQPQWRFTGGSLGVGIVQVIAMMSAATLVYRSNPAILGICAALWAISVWFYGRSLNA
jgi:hypothetical protein